MEYNGVHGEQQNGKSVQLTQGDSQGKLVVEAELEVSL
jgi:hypothetical protein